tara:strand:+ start:1561 stop:1944 length:384 start_codon:yes stop_codon:yes gene_type:complete
MIKEKSTSSFEPKSSRKAKVKKPNPVAQILNGEFLTKSFVLNNLPYIFFSLFLLILFVAKGYYVKQIKDEIRATQIQIDQNSADFLEVKTAFEIETRRQKLVEKLNDRGLKESLNATKVIRLESNDQ